MIYCRFTFYSARIATIGCTAAARRAEGMPARTATRNAVAAGERVDERLDAAKRVPRRIDKAHPQNGGHQAESDSRDDEPERVGQYVSRT